MKKHEMKKEEIMLSLTLPCSQVLEKEGCVQGCARAARERKLFGEAVDCNAQ